MSLSLSHNFFWLLIFFIIRSFRIPRRLQRALFQESKYWVILALLYEHFTYMTLNCKISECPANMILVLFLFLFLSFLLIVWSQHSELIREINVTYEKYQHHLLHTGRQVFKRRVDVKGVMLCQAFQHGEVIAIDRKSTRLNSSHRR